MGMGGARGKWLDPRAEGSLGIHQLWTFKEKCTEWLYKVILKTHFPTALLLST